MHRVGEAIQASGHEVVLVQGDPAFHPGWFQSALPTTDFMSWIKRTDLVQELDVIILAETFLPSLSSLKPGIPKILFNQNGAYTFGVAGQQFPVPIDVLSLYQHPDLKQVWCVSEHDRLLLTLGLGLEMNRVKLLVNGLESEVGPRGPKYWQVAYMPRKNSHDSKVVTALLKQKAWWANWSLKRIEKCSHAEVTATLQKSLLFLSFGHPEGFGLPVAEALACGCAVVGYTGIGGRELFDLADSFGLGIAVEPGDWLGFVEGVERINRALLSGKNDVALKMNAMASAVQQRYSQHAMQLSVVDAISHL